jgi:hypothetical protein
MTERLSGEGLRPSEIDEASKGVRHINTRVVRALAHASIALAFQPNTEGAPTDTDSTADDSGSDAPVED